MKIRICLYNIHSNKAAIPTPDPHIGVGDIKEGSKSFRRPE